MECPICQGSDIVIKNNNQFCNHCQMYIGKVKAKQTVNQLPIPTSSAPIQEANITDNVGFLAHFLPNFLVIAFFVLVFTLISFYPSHISLFPVCKIKVEYKSSSTFNKYVFEAIEKVKKDDYQTYSNLCSSINKIVEENCLVFDAPLETAGPGVHLTQLTSGGCFVKGTKIIYLQPGQNQATNPAELKAEALKKYAKIAKDYWQNR